MKLTKIVKQMIKEATEKDMMNYDDFTKIPDKSIYKKRTNIYSKESVLAANKKITSLVQTYLKSHPNFDSLDKNAMNLLIQFIRHNGDYNIMAKSLPNLSSKYGDLNTYLGYLVHYLQN